MMKITTVVVVLISLGCGGGQKSDTAKEAKYPLRDSEAPAQAGDPQPQAETPPARANASEGKTAPTDAQSALLEQAEADLLGMVEKICACPDKACLEALEAEFESFGAKYRDLENVQIPQEVMNRMMQLGQRVSECTQKIVGG
jgi:hypothetical protein